MSNNSDCYPSASPPCGCGRSAANNGVLMEMARRIKSMEQRLVDYIEANPGQQPTAGNNVKGSYELWLDAGNKGTVADFLKSLRGPGAYDIYLKNGGKGTEQDFLDSLKGEMGASSYKIWQLAGNFGSEQDFLDSLKGKNGTSAFMSAAQESNLNLAPQTMLLSIDAPISGTVERKHGLNGRVYCLVQNSYGGVELCVGAATAVDATGKIKPDYISVTVPAGETFVGSILVMRIKNQLSS